MKKTFQQTLISLSLVLFFSGCAFISGYKDSLNKFDKKVLANDCDLKDIEKKLKDNDNPLLWAIQGGSLARNCKDYNKSNYYFDYAETIYKEKIDGDSILNNALEVTGSIILNNNVNDFEGNTYEKIMVNTYKALNFASIDDFDNARVEFNRALDRQRRAKEYFENEIKEQKEKQAKEEKKFQEQKSNNRQKQSYNSPNEIIENKMTQKIIYEQYIQSFAEFKAYPDFINPFTTYLAGLFFTLNNDPIKGRDLLKEASGMSPQSKQIEKDLYLSDRLVKNDPQYKNKKFIWVIFENGNSLRLKKKNIRIPLFIVSKNPYLASIAFPELEEQKSSHTFLSVNGVKTENIASMDRVIKTEFQKRYQIIMTEIILSNILKAYIQYQLKQEVGPLGDIIGVLYQAATNTADIRSWTTLPKNFQVTRVENIGEKIEIKNEKGVAIDQVEVPKDKNAIIYIRSEIPQNNRIHKIIL